jgi:hypothetical protein
MNRAIKNLVEEYVTTEEKLNKELNKLRNGKGDCDCEEQDEYVTLMDIEIPNIKHLILVMRCLKCGGYITP